MKNRLIALRESDASGAPTVHRGHGTASTGFVYTNPLVGVEPQTPAGGTNG